MPWWKRAFTHIPGFRKRCPFGAWHPRWDQLCACAYGLPQPDLDWHGGIFLFPLGAEVVPCSACDPSAGRMTHQWPLTEEEEALIANWRVYRTQSLDHYGESTPYNYKIIVDLDGVKETLMQRLQGPAVLRDNIMQEEEGKQDGKPN